MIRMGVKSILMVILALIFFQAGLAQAGATERKIRCPHCGYEFFLERVARVELTEEQRALMERGKTEELAQSLTRGIEEWAERVSRLYTFIRDEIKVFHFEERRSPRRVLRDGAGRSEDKARLLSVLLDEIEVRGYLATINFVRFGEAQIYSFVALRVTREEAESLSKLTGGEGRFTHFPLWRREGRFISLVPLSGYFIGQLSPQFYQEVNGEWKEWKYRVRSVRF
ncbi:hypothetical protein LR003_03025 [candidate division NPL-UPA2 bacterium]|nr:hypothetical protein [candidate division NPL-UPA2 bacterium]